MRSVVPVWERFFAPVQTGSEAHPASYTMGTGSLTGVKRPGRGVDHPPHLAPRLKEVLRYTSTPSLGLGGMFFGKLYFYFFLFVRRSCLRSGMSRSVYLFISLLSITYRILSNILLSRLIPYAEEVTGEHQYGFRCNRSAIDHIFCIRQNTSAEMGIT
jgi:hypothetical protein